MRLSEIKGVAFVLGGEVLIAWMSTKYPTLRSSPCHVTSRHGIDMKPANVGKQHSLTDALLSTPPEDG